MAPFPETETMTIQRLEVALRKMDFKLLKDGAYKLHEKYHSGHKFVYLDLLKELFLNITNNDAIPNDIKDILAPTIEDILSSQGIKTDAATSPYESLNQNRVSSLTSLSYNTSVQQEPKINAFDAFGTTGKTDYESKEENNFINQNQYTQEPFKEFTPIPKTDSYSNEDEITNVDEMASESGSIQQNVETNSFEEIKEDSYQEKLDLEQEHNFEEETNENAVYDTYSNLDNKSIAIFYGEDSSLDKTKNILKYRELISKSTQEHTSITDILGLISEINTQSNTNVSELQIFIDQLKTKKNPISLITNSLSAHLINLLEQIGVSYEIYNPQTESRINLLPMFGLTNLFKCSQCSMEYLDTIEDISPLVLQCPKCKSPMFPNYYAANKINCEINIDYYNASVVALANSKVWVLIHPSIEEKLTLNLLTSALKVSNKIEEIYILDKDINVREGLANLFNEINSNIKIYNQPNSAESFFNSFN